MIINELLIEDLQAGDSIDLEFGDTLIETVIESVTDGGVVVRLDEIAMTMILEARKKYIAESKQGVAEGIARGPKEKALYELLYAWLAFTSLKATKIPNDAIDSNGHKELKSMQQHYLGPVINGMTMGEILKGDLWQNPKVIPHLLKYIYQGIPYIEERIKRFVRPSEQGNYLGDVGGMAKIKKLYKEVVAQYSQSQQGVAEAKYQGREVPLGKPMKGDVKKSKVYVKGPKGNVVKVNFGQKGVKIKKNNPGRRKNFRARHNCDNPGPRWRARYWSCRMW